MNIRKLALETLLEVEKKRVFSHVLVRETLDKYDYLSGQEKAFYKRVTEGTLERRIQLDYVIDAFSKVPVCKMKPFIRNLLRMSAYQILFMDAVPDRAVCDEAVKLSAAHSFHSLKGFVNGVLRTVARQKEAIAWPDPEQEETRYLSVKYSMPEWLIRLWTEAYGKERTKAMLAAFLAVRPVTLRVKETLAQEERARLLARMEEQGITVRQYPCLPYAWELTHVEGVKSLPGYEEGAFMVQDVSSMLCVEAAGIRENDRVLDVCAAPGGKATHAAIRLNGTGLVLARDLTQEKIRGIEENIRRQGLTNVRTQCHDALEYDREQEETADVLLADLPCSGLGILGKKRDIKYNVTPQLLTQLPLLQKKILDTVWRYVKPGGTLVYSTCTVHKEENEEIVKWFLATHPFEPVDLRDRLPEAVFEAPMAAEAGDSVTGGCKAQPGAGSGIENGGAQPGAGSNNENGGAQPGAGSDIENGGAQPGAGSDNENGGTQPGAGSNNENGGAQPGAGSDNENGGAQPGAGSDIENGGIQSGTESGGTARGYVQLFPGNCGTAHGYVQLFPGNCGTDGFFIAVLRRKGGEKDAEDT